MYHDGTPVRNDLRRIQIQKAFQGGQAMPQEEKVPVDGVAQFEIYIPPDTMAVEITVSKCWTWIFGIKVFIFLIKFLFWNIHYLVHLFATFDIWYK